VKSHQTVSQTIPNYSTTRTRQNVDAVPFAAEDLDFEVTRTIDVTGQAVARIENLFPNAIWKR
jgi:hypothetical protein